MASVFCPSLTDLLLPIFFALLVFYVLKRFFAGGKRRVTVLVLGDVGRSPRMQHHALSLANEGFSVDLLGFGGSQPFQEILDNRKISICTLSDSVGFHKILPRPMQYLYKVVRQSLSVFLALYLHSKKSSHILLQNPPGLPAIAVAKVVCILQGSRLVIDWHNYGFSIMALSHEPSSPIVKLAKWYEGVFGSMAHDHLCVTKAMQTDLLQRWGIRAQVLYDRPARMSGKTSIDVQHDLCMKLARDYKAFAAPSSQDADALVATSGVIDLSAFTGAFMLEDDTSQSVEEGTDEVMMEKDLPASSSRSPTPWVLVEKKRQCRLRPDRPALIVSSTSWTKDEDFSILLQALDMYDEGAKKDLLLPFLVCAITGKGPQKAHYIEEIAQRSWSRVSVCTPWLEPEDYPTLLGSADLGVCLHVSSSGLDLPMKVVDMFGSNLPVCAINFDCLSELVKDGFNGFVFNDAELLNQQITNALKGFPWADAEESRENTLLKMRANLKRFEEEKWHDNWMTIAYPMFKKKE